MTINLSERYLIVASLHRGYVLGAPLGFLLLSIGPRKSSIIRNGGHAFVWLPGRGCEECPLISFVKFHLFVLQSANPPWSTTFCCRRKYRNFLCARFDGMLTNCTNYETSITAARRI